MSNSLSNIQIELLKTFSHDVSEKDLLEVKSLLTNFFGKKAITEANKKWDDNSWSDNKAEELLKTHKRTHYPNSK
jgi:hypothetical protein